ncbi:unnamed protein product [Blepharisma stoltei]|uniref:Uncharacterized protein n=1 Tax=Blepharisma stoltei TaxID=1481888 RepID=A0AAU9JBI3_9CILI|nr:unnamed protein product [Blepharisma stoltei]
MAEYNEYNISKFNDKSLSPNSAQTREKSPTKSSYSSLRVGSPIRFQYLNIRPRSSYVTAPSTKKIGPPDSTSSHLGPGRYYHAPNASGPSFEFSRSSRFQDQANLSHDISQFLKQRQQLFEEKETKKIEENKDMRKYSPDQKILRAKSMSRRQRARSDIARQAKNCIYEAVKKDRQEQLAEKFKKLDMRMRKNEVFKVRLSWIAIFTMFGSANVIRVKLKRKIQLRRRAMATLKWLRQVSKCVGKIAILGRKIRRIRANRVLQFHLVNRAKRWLKKRRERNMNTIVNMIETSITSSVMLKTMFSWQQKLYAIQRGMKRFIMMKRTYYFVWLNKWNETEHEIFEKNPVRKGKRRKTIKEKTQKTGASSIPEEIKEIYIREYARKRVKEYNEKYHRYVIETQNLNEYIETHLKGIGSWNSEIDKITYPSRPIAPNISSELTKDLMSEMIHSAERDRMKWSQIIEAEQKKILMSKK